MGDSLDTGFCTTEGRSWESRVPSPGESKREQQFYSYYGPFRRMSKYGPVFCNLRDPLARKQHKPVSCADKTLTALCQLGALRMKAKRCLIIFFDINHAYTMAESTRSLSLEQDSVHETGDQLWMGHSVVPRDIACCEITVNLPAFPVYNTCTADYAQNVFEVNDLPSHPKLHARPYVSEWPTGRSYVGVLITTPEGINIGAYCVLDDKPREAASQTEILFMRDMSQTVMSHLETVRALSERSQRNRLVTGLGSFVRNTTYSKPQQRPTGTIPRADGTSDYRPKRRSTTATPLPDDSNGPAMHTSLLSALIDPVSA